MTDAAMIALIKKTRDDYRPSPRRDSPEASLACIAAVAAAAQTGSPADAVPALLAIDDIIACTPMIVVPTVGEALVRANEYSLVIEFQAPCIGGDPALGDQPCRHWFQFSPAIDGISEDWTSRMFDDKEGWEPRRMLGTISIDDLRRECRIVSVEEADENPAGRF